MTRELSLLAGIFKNLVVEKSSATGSNDSTALKLPVKFIAIIKKINQELALLTWKGKSFYVQIDTPVKENELLLLQLKKESQGKQFYQVIARSPAEGENSCTTSWYVFPPQRENTPPLPFLKLNYFQHQKRNYDDEPTGPSLEIALQTRHLGFIILRFSSFTSPYTCRLLVEREDYGTLLQSSLSLLQEQLEKQSLPIIFLPFKVISSPNKKTDETELNLFLDKKA